MIPITAIDSFINQVNLLNVDLLQFKKDLGILISTDENELCDENKEKLSEMVHVLNEIMNLKKETDDLIELNETYEEKTELNTKLSEDKLNHEYLIVLKEYENIQKEDEQFQDLLKKVSKTSEYQSDLRLQSLKQQAHESQMNIIQNDYKIINQINKAQQTILNTIDAYAKQANSSEDVILKEYSILELLTGVKVVEKIELENSEINSKNWYDILFTNLSDECLDFEKNNEDHPLLSKSKKSQLSNELLDKYRSVFKKRKKNNIKNTKSCVVLNDLNDFQVIYQNYLSLLCFILGKQEIEEAKKQFALDWIEGSQVLTILINSKSSKMATIVLPKFYPLSGTSLIKLISLSGFENSDIKNFKIEKNLNSLSEWISKFTDLYNTNQIIS